MDPWLADRYQPEGRDPREVDPTYYRDSVGRLVKRTEWSSDNVPTCHGEALIRYLQETTPAERRAILKKVMRRKGLYPVAPSVTQGPLAYLLG